MSRVFRTSEEMYEQYKKNNLEHCYFKINESALLGKHKTKCENINEGTIKFLELKGYKIKYVKPNINEHSIYVEYYDVSWDKK